MKIVLGYDGSEAAKKALKQASRQAKAFDGKVYVVASVVSGAAKQTHEIEQSRADLTYAEKYFKEKGVLHESHLLVRGLSPGEDLVQFAGENKADMIIIGVKRKSKVGKLVFGSTAQQVILEASCPVLTVK
jgi:nucleotide-binding universal stress UspA family protein